MVAGALSGAARTREELRRLIRSIEQRPQPRPAPSVPRAPLHRLAIEELAPGWTRSVAGTFVYEHEYPLDYCVGTQALSGLSEACGDVLVLLGGDDDTDSCEASRLLFLDIETTGLAGAGAIVFLVSTGQLMDGGFRLRQYLAASPADEGALLHDLARDITESGASVLVTYNGRTFDAPFLDQRAVMHRMRGRYQAMTQLDLLRGVRRGFRTAFASCRLAFVEAMLLNLSRPEDEVSGADVPTSYYRFLRAGDARHLQPTIGHNALDVLSLAAVTARLAAVVSGTADATGAEAFAAGRMLLAQKRHDSARRQFDLAARSLASGLLRDEALAARAGCERRLRLWPEAVATWEELAQRPGYGLRAFVELAKYHEHVRRDYLEARAHVERAMEIAGASEALRARHTRLVRREDTKPRVRPPRQGASP